MNERQMDKFLKKELHFKDITFQPVDIAFVILSTVSATL